MILTNTLVKRATITATQKTALTIVSKVVITTATTATALAVNSKIQESQANKIRTKAEKSIEANVQNPESPIMTDEEIAKEGKRAIVKANVASGAVIGVGAALQTVADICIAAL